MFISKLSNSKSDTFRQCPFKGRLKYIDYIPEDVTRNERALKFGSYIHKIFEDGYKENCKENFLIIAEQLKPKYKVKKSEEKKAVTCIDNFIKFNTKLLSQEGSTTMGVELDLTEELDSGMQYNGIIDRVVSGSDGGVLVIDYKTGREKTKKDLFSDPQLQGYAFLINKKFGIPIHRITCAHYYPVTNNFIPIKYSTSQIEKWRREKISEIWKYRKMKISEFLPRVNSFCDWCGYIKYCPKKGDPSRAPLLLEEACKQAKIEYEKKKEDRKS